MNGWMDGWMEGLMNGFYKWTRRKTTSVDSFFLNFVFMVSIIARQLQHVVR